MPKYSTLPERFDGAVHFPVIPCDGIAADGTVIPGCFYVDTETGVTIRHKRDENDHHVEWYVERAGGLVEVVEVFKAPIQIVPYDPSRHCSPSHVVGPTDAP